MPRHGMIKLEKRGTELGPASRLIVCQGPINYYSPICEKSPLSLILIFYGTSSNVLFLGRTISYPYNTNKMESNTYTVTVTVTVVVSILVCTRSQFCF